MQSSHFWLCRLIAKLCLVNHSWLRRLFRRASLPKDWGLPRHAANGVLWVCFFEAILLLRARLIHATFAFVWAAHRRIFVKTATHRASLPLLHFLLPSLPKSLRVFYVLILQLLLRKQLVVAIEGKLCLVQLARKQVEVETRTCDFLLLVGLLSPRGRRPSISVSVFTPH